MRAWLTAVLLVLAVPLSARAQPTELEIAYQREFAYLEAEKAALEGRIASLDAETKRRVADAEADLSALQARLLTLRNRRTRAEEELGAALRDADTVTEAQDMVESTLFQADSSLSEVDLPDTDSPESQVAALTTAYTQGAALVHEAGKVRVEPGSWFLPSGQRVEGQQVRIGRIARFGVAEQSGALLPVGDGKLQLRDTDADAAGIARALAGGERPQPLGLFAYEDTGKRIEEAPPRTWWTTLQAGGLVGWVIVVLGTVGVVLAVLRTLGLLAAGRGSDVVQAALERLDQGRWDDALKVSRSAPGSAPRVVEAMLEIGSQHRVHLEDKAAEAILTETPKIERFGTAILVIAAVAPLLGLLGTVTGMIGTFEVITEFGTGDPRMLSGGISEALVTTQLGLIVAIPMLLVGNLLNRFAEREIGRLEVAAVAVMNRVGEDPSPARTATPRVAANG